MKGLLHTFTQKCLRSCTVLSVQRGQIELLQVPLIRFQKICLYCIAGMILEACLGCRIGDGLFF